MEIVRLAQEKKADDATVLDMTHAVTYTDYFIILNGHNPRQTTAIAQEIQRGLREEHVRPLRCEGEREGQWILIDYLDVVVHIFTPDARDFYRLEVLWGDVPRLELADPAA